MLKLIIADDEGNRTVAPLVRDTVTIGREEGNTIRLTERNISRKHARLVRGENGVEVEDLGSYNGIKVNGERIEKKRLLTLGDEVAIGDYQIILESDRVIEESDAEPEKLVPPARLVMISQPTPGAEFAIARSGVRIGRAEDLEIWVNDRSISREHATIKMVGDTAFDEDATFTLIDLGSANGSRVNGEDADRVELKNRDLLELGQVKFRFVGVGEDYEFDPEETVVVALPRKNRSRAFFIALLIVLLAAAIAGFILYVDSKKDPASTQVTVTDLKGPSPEEAADDALTTCNTALAKHNWSIALTSAERALSLNPASKEAITCRQKAEAGKLEHEYFKGGCEALAAGNIDEAYFSFAELDLKGPYAAKPEVMEATEAYAKLHLQRAKDLVESDVRQATREADHVVRLGLEPYAEQAQTLIREMGHRPGATPKRRPETPVARPVKPKDAGTQRVTNSGQSTKSTKSSFASAQECLRKNDNQCVIRTLEGGRAKSARELALLIETYRTVGNSPKARQHMKTFVRRYPTHRSANRYSRLLQAN